MCNRRKFIDHCIKEISISKQEYPGPGFVGVGAENKILMGISTATSFLQITKTCITYFGHTLINFIYFHGYH